MIIDFSKAVCMPVDDILGQSRRKDIALCRKVYYWLLHKNGFSYSEIARLIGCNHSTVMYAVNNINGAIDIGDKVVLRIVNKVEHIKRDYEPDKTSF